MNYLDKYYIKDLTNSSINENDVYISAKFQKQWFKIPKICYEVLNYSSDNKITVEESIDLFEDSNDKEYFKKILKNLDNIGVLMEAPIDKVYISKMNKITFAITNKCNLKCSFCSQDSKIEDEEELSFEEIKSIINKIMMFKPLKIVLTGGEPMLRKDFFDIIDYIKSNYDVDIQLCTNGTLINKFNIEKLRNTIYAVDLSLDGYDEYSCSKVRGKCVFEKVINSINLLKENGINRISASMVVGNHNLKDAEKFVEFCEKNAIIPVKREFMSLGRGKVAKQYLKDPRDSMYYPENENLEEKIVARTCGAGIMNLYVDHKGNVFPCSLLDYDRYKLCAADDINQDLVNKIFRREIGVYTNLEKLSPLNNYRCKDCKYKLFCNNCLANIHIMSENEETFRHNCEKIKKIYEKWVR